MNYSFVTADGQYARMFSVPVSAQIEMFSKRMGQAPESFFDIGCATGELVRKAEDVGLSARGVDIQQYPVIPPSNQYLFDTGRVQINSVLNCGYIFSDIAFANGTLLYFSEQDLNKLLDRLRTSKMLIAIHNTAEDIDAAAAAGMPILHSGPRLIKSNDWWMDKFRTAGFDVSFDEKYGCFCAASQIQQTLLKMRLKTK